MDKIRIFVIIAHIDHGKYDNRRQTPRVYRHDKDYRGSDA